MATGDPGSLDAMGLVQREDGGADSSTRGSNAGTFLRGGSWQLDIVGSSSMVGEYEGEIWRIWTTAYISDAAQYTWNPMLI